jgi:hypothetical protein
VSELEHIKNHCDAIEEWYEFMLAFAAQGIADDRQSPYGSQLRELLAKAVDAATELPAAYSAMVTNGKPAAAEKYLEFVEVLKVDTTKALAAMELVLAQPKISSQLVDNLNASLHVRTLLTDVFLLDEIVQLQQLS